MLRKSGHVTALICIVLFLTPPLTALLLIIRQPPAPPESIGRPRETREESRDATPRRRPARK